MSNGSLVIDGPPFDLDLRNLEHISLRMSGPPLCTGRVEDGLYLPCPEGNHVKGPFSQCTQCLLQDIPEPDCIFDPRCNRGTCGAGFCRIEHVVYITAFRDSFKVGMTQWRRMRTRAMEQGADGMIPILELADRFSARSMEGSISRYLGLPQMVRSETKLKNLITKRDTNRISDDLLSLRDELKRNWDVVMRSAHHDVHISKPPDDLNESPLMIDDYPLQEPLASRPRTFKGERLFGKVLGYKGSYMVFWSGGIWAFRLADAPGTILHSEADLH